MEKCLREEVYIGMLHNIVKTLSCWSNSQFVLWFTQLTIRLYVCLIICNAAFPYNIALMREEDSIYTFPVFATVFKYLLSPRWRNDAVNCRRPNLSVLNLSGLGKIKIVRNNFCWVNFFFFFFFLLFRCEISNLLTEAPCISPSCRYCERTQSVLSSACTPSVSDDLLAEILKAVRTFDFDVLQSV